MGDIKFSQLPLPTLDRLGSTVPPNLDAKKVAAEWFQTFSSCAEFGKIDDIVNLFIEDGFWRDILALTWDFRTFTGTPRIKKFLTDRLTSAQVKAFKLKDEYLGLQQPYPDLAWIQAMFTFETNVGICSGIFRLVPLSDGTWKAHGVFTNLEDLKGHAEKIGHLRNPAPNHGKWAEQRRREVGFEDTDPVVLIAGGGHNGLGLAARLKCLGIPNLVIEKKERIGDNWRSRYEALCLHDPVWYDHMPYLPFPPTWPVYTPALKLANWLEIYAESLELNVWTSSTVTHASQDASNKWCVTIKRADGRESMVRVKHLIFATGFGGGEINLPSYPGMDRFKGQILHSTEHHKAIDHTGKKVVVVGSATSAHDIATDYYNNGIDVTMIQRSPTYVMSTKNGWKYFMEGTYSENGPPTDIADRLTASFPFPVQVGVAQRRALKVAEADKELLDGLRERGFKTDLGPMDAGFLFLARGRGGGYYLDVGGSQLIIDGKIKLKNDSKIERFTDTGIRFENGSELAADVVIFATGWGDVREILRKVCGDEVAEKSKQLWGMSEEGEMNGAWRELGIPGLWYMMGNLALCRFHSKHVALQIKAMEENMYGTQYGLD